MLIDDVLDGEIVIQKRTDEQVKMTGDLSSLEVMPIKKIEVESLKYFPSGYDDRYSKYGSFTAGQVENVFQSATNHIERILKSAEIQHDLNVEAIKNNTDIVNGIKKMMDKFGVRSTYSTFERKTKRSYKETETRHSAGYLEDLRRDIKTSDGFSNIQIECSNFKEKIEKWRLSELTRIKQEETKIKNDELLAAANRELMKYIVKYDLPATSSKENVVDYIISKDKYLYLAHYMKKNRGDWNDGYWYAEQGLDNFTVTEDIDEKIHKCVQFEIDNWDGDGRCFRDCEYSYDVVFGYVDSELYADYNKLINLSL
jgi:hypothetical protein